MELIKTPTINWIEKRWTFFAFSAGLLGASLLSIAVRGFNYAIDFTGGTMIQVTYEKPKDLGDLRKDLDQAGYEGAMPQRFTGPTSTFSIRLKGGERVDAQTVEAFAAKLQEQDTGNKMRVDKKEYVGPSVGRHLKRQAVFALSLALVGIVIYVGFRFTNLLWGAAGLAALFHDVIATAGLLSVLQRELDLVLVAALMAIAGYSINDTIVIFDRMRERMRMNRREPLDVTVNTSINEMMSRTLITNGCVIAVDLVLLVFGGPVLRDFATAMLFGGVVGTYSTIAVATPLVFEWERRSRPALASQQSAPAQGGDRRKQKHA